MCKTKKIADRRDAFTLVEMLVVIAIILVVAALAAAFAPRVDDNQKLSRAVDNLEQWLLTAKMRAKRDGLATGIRFIQTQGDVNIDPGLKLVPPVATVFSQFQYIQQPEPLSGGVCVGGPAPALLPPAYQYPPVTGNYYTGGLLISAAQTPANSGLEYVTFFGTNTPAPVGVDFSLGGTPQFDAFGRPQWLVQSGDYLEINGGGVYLIANVVTPPPGQPATTLQLGATPYDLALNIPLISPASPMTNYRILRQPRVLIGEEPLSLPNNYAVNFNAIPGYLPATPGSNVIPRIVKLIPTPPVQYYEILFSPTGAIIGTNAGNPTIVISVWDTTMDTPDSNRVGIVGVQSRSGFIGAYGVSLSANPFLFVQTARESGL
jgi:prepilin-type N-terminal cleavage/methylation domain-containing protein